MRKFLCFVLVLSLLFVGGCGLMDWIFPEKGSEPPPESNLEDDPVPEGSEVKTRRSILFIADAQANYILPVSYDIPWEEGIAKAVIAHLVEGGPAHQFLATKGLKAVIPAGTTVLGMTVKDGLATVDFSPQLLQTADVAHEELLLDALTYTLTEFDSIEGVALWVEGKPLTAMVHGTPVAAVLTRERGMNSKVSAKGTGVVVTVYFHLDSPAGGNLFVPVTRPVASAAELGAAALEQLIGGPADSESGLKGVIPAATRIQSLSIEGEMAVVDFSSELAQAEMLEAAVAAIVLTLTELPNINRVKLTVGGQNIVLPDGRSIVEPVLRPLSTNPLAF